MGVKQLDRCTWEAIFQFHKHRLTTHQSNGTLEGVRRPDHQEWDDPELLRTPDHPRPLISPTAAAGRDHQTQRSRR